MRHNFIGFISVIYLLKNHTGCRYTHNYCNFFVVRILIYFKRIIKEWYREVLYSVSIILLTGIKEIRLIPQN